jgi:uncharacterized membrane protein YbhN (UPF0104 family)
MFLRAAISVALVALIVWWAGADEIGALLAQVSVSGLAVVVSLHIADRLLMAYKWWRLLRARGYGVPLSAAVRAYFLASFVGAVIPVAGGADLARIAATRGKGASTEALISSVALERALGAISHGFFCLAAVALAVGLRVNLEISSATLAIGAGAAVLLLTLGLPLSFVLADTIASRIGAGAQAPTGLAGKIGNLAYDYAGWRDHPRELWIFLALTFVEGFYPILGYYAAALALNIDASLVQMAIAVPLAFLIARLPIPLPSFGPEQGVFVTVAMQLGITQAGATAVTLLFLGTLLVAFSPGAIAWLSSPPAPTDRPAPPA